MRTLTIFWAVSAFLLLTTKHSYAQQGSLTLYNNPPGTTATGQGDVATKIVANYRLYTTDNSMMMDVTWDVTPTNYLFYAGKVYTRQQLGDDVFSQLTLAKIFVCEADAFYQGVNLGVVTFDCSGCGGAYAQSSTVNCTGKVIGGKASDGKSDVFKSRSFEEAKSIWVSGGIKFNNFRLAKTAGGNAPTLYTLDIVRSAVKKLEGENQTGNSQKEEPKANNSTNSENGNTANITNNNNAGKQIYDQTLEQNKNILEKTEQLNQQVTNLANDLGNSINEERHREAEQATAEMARKQAEWERQIDARSKVDREDMKRRYEAYKQSSFYRTDQMYASLEEDALQYADWIAACKDGSKDALERFAEKYPNSQFGKSVSNLLATIWMGLEKTPELLRPSDLSDAIKHNDWKLAKALLAKGVKATYWEMDTLGNYYSPLQQLFTPRYKTGEALKYINSDRDELFRQLVINGADPNMPWEAKIYAGEINGYNHVIDLIIGNDYKGQNLEWLLQNNKLTKKTIQYMFVKLAYYDAEAFAKGVKDAYETSCKLHGDLQHKTNAYDLFYIEIAKLVKYGAPLTGTYTHPDYRTSKICLTPQDHDRESNTFYPELYAVWLNVGDINSFLDFQHEILNRASEVDKIYLYKLAQTCIENDGTRTDALGNSYDFRPLLKRIIQAGASSTAKEIEWNNKFYSMMSLAKEKNSALIDFLKNIQSVKPTPNKSDKERTDKIDNGTTLLSFSDGTSVSKDEFLKLFYNNSKEKGKTACSEYLNLFIGYKLKILQACKLNYDKSNSFIKAVSDYTEQLKSNPQNGSSLLEYQKMVKEFIEGTLVFEITDKTIWSVADANSEVVKNYFAQNQSKYNGQSFESIKGKVVADCQADLEKNWIEELRKEFPVQVNQKALDELLNSL